jgi:hypothetical protein
MEPDEQASREEIANALRDLLQSRGWQLLKEQAEREWGPAGYGRRLEEALATVDAGPDRAYAVTETVDRVRATARAVSQILAWPSEQLRTAAPAKQPSAFERLRRVHR